MKNNLRSRAYRSIEKASKNLLIKPLCVMLLCAGTISGNAQITSSSALDPNGAGGFELGSTFAANGWTAIAAGGSDHNFQVGNASGVQSGSNAVYIPTYSGGAGYVTHIYKDVAIPAGATNIVLSFYIKLPSADDTYDYEYVSITNTSTTPVANTAPDPANGFKILFQNTSSSWGGYTQMTAKIPSTYSGSTVRIVFSFLDDGASPGTKPSFDNIGITYNIAGACTRVFGTPSVSPQTFTVPAGVTSVAVNMSGASGGDATNGGNGGAGGSIVCTLAVTPSTALNIYVGGAGSNGVAAMTSAGGIGISPGGNGGAGNNSSGGGGGATSEIRIGGTAIGNRALVAAGGGGGAAGNFTGGNGGNPGTNGAGNSAARAGKGATIAAVGAGGTGNGNGVAGTNNAGGGNGGAGAATGNQGGGGGGAGYNGGGGGASGNASNVGSGGGGANFVTGTGPTAVTNGASTDIGNGYVYITIASTPTVTSMTGGGTACADPGINVGLTSTQSGVVYQLKRDGTDIGSPVTSTGGALDFGPQTLSGTYTAVAYFAGFPLCTTPMTGTAVVNITSPTLQTVTAPGNGYYCEGSAGTPISLNNSDVTASYTLGRNGVVVQTLNGSGGPLNFSPVTTAGTYTVISSNISAPACPVQMTGSVDVASIPPPVVQTVSGGGDYCTGASGSVVSLGGSQINVIYTLGRPGVIATTAPGTGSALNFAPQTIDGTYTVSASYASPLPACPVQMSGSAMVTSLPAPLLVGLNPSQTACPANTATYSYTSALNGGNQYTLTWSPSGVLNDVTAPTVLPGPGGIVVNVPGAASNQSFTGTLHIINSSTGCSFDHSITLDVDPGPSEITILPNTASSVCLGVGLPVTASAVHPLDGVLVAQNFNSGLTGQKGGTWTIVNIEGIPESYWQIRPSPGYTSDAVDPTTGDGSPFMQVAGDAYFFGITTSAVVSPAFSTMNLASVTISYNQSYIYLSGDIARLQYSLNGTTWNNIRNQAGIGDDIHDTWDASSPEVTVNLPAGALNKPTVYLRWAYDADWSYAWAIDNVVVTGSGTPLVYNWTGIGGATGLSCTSCDNPTITPASVGDNVYSVTTTYGGCTSTAGISIFTTNSAPAAPTFAGSSFTCNSITLNWLGGSGASDFQLTVSTDPTMATGIVYGPTLVGNVLTKTITGLSGNTTYYYRLRGSNSCFGFGAYSAIENITTTPTPNITPGTSPICATSTSTWVGTPAGGTWASETPSVATVSSAGLVTGVSAGSSVISYFSGGCVSTGTQLITEAVFPPAFVITPASANICAGGQQQLSAPAIPLGNTSPVFTYTGAPVAIIDNDPTGSTASINISGIPASATILDMRVTLIRLTHSYVRDLGISLKAPNNNVINLLNHRGDDGVNFINTVISSTGTGQVPNNGATAPFTGTYRASLATGADTGPSGQLANSNTWSSLYSVPNGTWTLGIADNGNLDVGNLVSWSITIHYSVPGSYTWTGSNLFNDAGLTSPYLAGTETNTVYASPVAPTEYTAIAAYAGHSCLTTNTAVITPEALPVVQTVTGTGTGCSATGVAVGLANSETGVSYQLYNDATAIGSPVAGVTGNSISFGAQTTAGTYTVLATNQGGLGCPRVMNGSAVVTIVANPDAQTLSGGGAGCAGTGVEIGLTNSQSDVDYTLYNGSTATGTVVAGSDGNPITFGYQMTAGTYTVSASNHSTLACPTDMPGSKVVTIDPLPVVTGLSAAATNPCIGSASTVTLTSANLVNSTTYTVNYTLSGASGNNATADASMTFGAGSGTFQVIAGNLTNAGATTVTINSITETATTCGAAVTGVTANLTVKTVPGAITGTTTICYGAGTTTTTLSNDAVLGTWSSGNNAVATVNATTGVVTSASQGVATISYDNGCGTAAIQDVTVNATPAAITGADNLCYGAGTATASLANTSTGGTWSSSNIGVATVGLNDGMVTSAGQGITTITYDNGCGTAATKSMTVNATPAAITGNAPICADGVTLNLANTSTNGTWSSSAPATASVSTNGTVTSGAAGGFAIISYDNGCGAAAETTVTVNALPATVVVAGGGFHCDEATLTASNGGDGTIYFQGNTSGGTSVTMPSTSEMVTMAGTYYFRALSAEGCWSNEGSAAVTIGITPDPVIVAGSGSYCGSATITATGGANGTIYFQGTASGGTSTVTASTSEIISTPGIYYFRAMSATGCWGAEGSATVTALPLPDVQTFTGGGGYCSGDPGVNIGLTLTENGVSYQLFEGTTPQGSPIAGTGGPITFGIYTAPGYYYAIATNTTTMCTQTLPGVTVHVNDLPAIFDVTGGGSYCSSGGAGVDVSLGGSEAGVDYQLYNGTTVVSTVSGTGGAISFGLQPAGTYSVMGMNATTGCTNGMNGAVTVDFYPSPAQHTVTGGGTYCLGGDGVQIGLDGSDAGIDYQLIYLGVIPIGGAENGTGAALDLGPHYLPGDYTVVATDVTTGCTDTMTGDAQINFALPPTFYFVGGGGGYCAGDTGVHITLNGSANGVSYQLYHADTAVGTPVAGTGTGLDFGLFTTVGIYTVKATDETTGCTSNMLFSATVSVNPVVMPAVSLNTGLGADNRVCYGSAVTFTAQTMNGGTTPAYEWKINNLTVTPPDSTYTYVPVDGDIVWVKMTSSSLCAVPAQAMDTMVVDVDTMATPSVFIDVNPITSVPPGTPVTLTAIVTNGGPSPLFQWYRNGVAIAGATNAVYTSSTLVNKDSMMVRVISSGGCGGVITFNAVVITVYAVSVPDMPASISDVRLIPNPNKGQFSVQGTLSTGEDADVDLEVVNMLGQVVYKGKITARKGVINEQIHLANNLANGMYMLNLQSGNDRKVFHFVLEQ